MTLFGIAECRLTFCNLLLRRSQIPLHGLATSSFARDRCIELRRGRRHRGGVTLFGTAGYFVAPLCFAAGVAVAGWTVPLVVMAALPAIATLFVARRLLRS